VNRNHVANDLESTFVLIPQFAAIRHLQDAAAHIEWYVDGNTAPSHTDDPGRITFVAEEGGVETSLAALFSVDNSSLQEVRSMWKITFDAVTESALDLFRPSVE
jgi:hypothetical protein